jgi:hypothetical protein
MHTICKSAGAPGVDPDVDEHHQWDDHKTDGNEDKLESVYNFQVKWRRGRIDEDPRPSL